MTTLVGLCDEDGNEVILASDRQGSWVSSEGDFVRKSPGKKLYVSEDKKIALGTAGSYDARTDALVEGILSGRIDLAKAIDGKKLQELANINVDRFEGKIPDGDKCTSLLIATRFDVPRLYTCWPMGMIEPREVTYVGSGSKYVKAYLEAEAIINQARPEASILDSGKLTQRVARELVYRAVKHAAKFDPFSSGLDFVKISREGIDEFGLRIEQQEDAAHVGIMKLLGLR
jgi:20S proteasome alpha/beta subunit